MRLGVGEFDDTGGDGKQLGQLSGTVTPRSCDQLEAARVRTYRDGLDEAVVPNALDDELHVIAEASNGEEALRRIAELQPQVAILDIDTPGMNGLAVARELQGRNLSTQIIFMTLPRQRRPYARGKAFDLSDRVARDSAKGIAQRADKTGKVTLYYTEDAGRKTVHFISNAI